MGAISNCPSVVYLPAGEHRLTIKYIYANYYADKEFPVNVSAGKTYQVTSTSADLKKALFGVTEKPESFQLKYKDLVPVLKEKFKEKGEDLVLSRNAD